jgi:hypothetical protein
MQELQDPEENQAGRQIRHEHTSQDTDEVAFRRQGARVVQFVQLVVDPDVRGLVQDSLSDQEHGIDEGPDQGERQESRREHRDENEQRARSQGTGHDRQRLMELHANFGCEEGTGTGPAEFERHPLTPRQSSDPRL